MSVLEEIAVAFDTYASDQRAMGGRRAFKAKRVACELRATVWTDAAEELRQADKKLQEPIAGRLPLLLIESGEYDDHRTEGTFEADPRPDWKALEEQYVRHVYVEASAKQQDFANPTASDFIHWLCMNGHLKPVQTEHRHQGDISTYNRPYEPEHWPLCPRCEEGRGEPIWQPGSPDHERVRCTRCDHTFDPPAGGQA